MLSVNSLSILHVGGFFKAAFCADNPTPTRQLAAPSSSRLGRVRKRPLPALAASVVRGGLANGLKGRSLNGNSAS